MPAAYSVPQAPVDDASVDGVDREIALVSHIVCICGTLGGSILKVSKEIPGRNQDTGSGITAGS